ncbi:hypothetical protein [Rhizobium leguminosarum]|uniref:hypothetical protein n=1 Tax=Rhizobium leguminosarum TaxID=384 RepID=UPI002E164355|nr:hypothetical protein U8Q02_39125 [Rhizobium leguminosarum]
MSSDKTSGDASGITVSNHPTIQEIADAVERTVRNLSSHNNTESRLAAHARAAMQEGRRTILPENEAAAPTPAPVIDIGRRRRNILIWIDPLARAS